MGSKSKIAKQIVSLFPNADNFVDLFAGGGAVTHYAMTTNKYKHFVFNDINPLMPKAFEMALNGEFENENRWISREEFFRLRDTDPYAAICFSFGNNLSTYAYGKDIEPIKEAYHYALFFGDYSLAKERMGVDFSPLEKCATIKEKYTMLRRIVKTTPPISGNNVAVNGKTRTDLQNWERIQRVSENCKVQMQCCGHFCPPTKVRKCAAKIQMLRNAMQWGAIRSPCLTLLSSILQTTNLFQSLITALSIATYPTWAQERTNVIKRRSLTMSGSTIGRTAKRSRYLSASIGCPKIGLYV